MNLDLFTTMTIDQATVGLSSEAATPKYLRVTNSQDNGAPVDITGAVPTAVVYGGVGTATVSIWQNNPGIVEVQYNPQVSGNALVVVNVDSTNVLNPPLASGDQFREVDFFSNPNEGDFTVLPGFVSVEQGIATTLLPNGWQNSAYEVTFPVVDANGNPINLLGQSLRMDLWLYNQPETPIITATTLGGELVIGGLDDNNITLSLLASQLIDAGQYVWLLRPADNVTPPYASGKWTISAAPPI